MRQYWGPRYWYFLHSLISSYPENPNDIEKALYMQMFLLFINLIPCSICKRHFIKTLKKHPLKMNTRDEWVKWGFEIHNIVNKRLDKDILKLEKFDKMYVTIDHQYLYDFLMYNKNRAYQGQIQFQDFLMLLSIITIVFPCKKCKFGYAKKYKEDNIPKLMSSRLDLDKWIKKNIKPKGIHMKDKNKNNLVVSSE
jgi:hypothetical protein